MKKIVSLLLVVMMALSAVAFAAAEPMPKNYDNYPICEPGAITLKFTSVQTPVQNEYNSGIWSLNHLEEKTGIHIEWTNVPSDMRSEKLNLMLATLDLPDALFKMSVSNTQQAQYGAEGAFVDLVQYKEVMPNLWYWYEDAVDAGQVAYPTARDAMMQADGCMYGTPYLLTGYAIRMGTRLYGNTDVFEKLGVEGLPTTLDGLYEYLLACKNLDYNGNGIADEIPLAMQGSSNQGDALDQILFGSFGLRNVGSSFSYVDLDPEGNGLRFIQTSEAYKDYLKYTAKLYQEGLIDADLFTTDFAGLIAKCQEGRALNYLFVNNSPVAGSEYEQYTQGMTQPFAGEHNLWTNYSMPASSSGAFVITFLNEHPEESAKWVDYLYSEDGILSYFLGIQGENAEDTEGTWYYDEETGAYDYTNWILNDPNGTNFEQMLAPYVVWQGGGNPSVATNECFKGGETWPCSLESAAGLINYVPEDVWAPFTFSSEISGELSRLQADFSTYYREWRAQFWAGTKDIDADWDAYVEGYNALGVEEYMGFYTEKAIEMGKIAG